MLPDLGVRVLLANRAIDVELAVLGVETDAAHGFHLDGEGGADGLDEGVAPFVGGRRDDFAEGRGGQRVAWAEKVVCVPEVFGFGGVEGDGASAGAVVDCGFDEAHA